MLFIIVLISLNFFLLLFAPLLQLLLFFLIVLLLKRRSTLSSQREDMKTRLELTEGETVVGFFHPYCNAGGGGERVLWVAIKALQIRYKSKIRIMVYTGDLDAYQDSQGDSNNNSEVDQARQESMAAAAILLKVKNQLGIDIDPVTFIFLNKRHLIEAKRYPRFTLIMQALGTMLLGSEALSKCNPDVMIDTLGCHFAAPVFRYLGGCKTACYVHYPIISTDMIQSVSDNVAAFNNDAGIASSVWRKWAKLIYYKMFAVLYRCVGRSYHIVLTNSTWTHNHILSLWKQRFNITILYPPVCLEEFSDLTTKAAVSRKPIILSISQFRPEKNQRLQLKAFQLFLQTIASPSTYRLVMAGGCRNPDDFARVEELKSYAETLGIESQVDFEVNISYERLKDYLLKASVGLHTMINEHFGIGIVDMMAAGLVVVAHRSGGPKMDIVTSDKVGFLAATAQEYSEEMCRAFSLSAEARGEMFLAARKHIQQFAQDEFFMPKFCDSLHTLIDYRAGVPIPG